MGNIKYTQTFQVQQKDTQQSPKRLGFVIFNLSLEPKNHYCFLRILFNTQLIIPTHYYKKVILKQNLKNSKTKLAASLLSLVNMSNKHQCYYHTETI